MPAATAPPGDGSLALPHKFCLADVAAGTPHIRDLLVDRRPVRLEGEPLTSPEAPGAVRLVPLYVPLPRRWEMRDLPAELSSFLEGESGDSDVIVFRAHPGDEDAVRRECSDRPSLRRRTLGRPIWMLAIREGRHRLVDLATDEPPVPPDVEQRYVDFLRECELTGYTERPGIYLPGSEGFHYEAPSGRHYDTFLRVGNMLSSREAVEALCFWLAPALAATSVLLLDSPSILSLGLSARDYVRDAIRDAPGFGVEALSSPDEQEVTVVKRLKAATTSAADRPPLTFLISVVSSGGLARRVRKLCEGNGFDTSVFGVFGASELKPGRAPDGMLCELGHLTSPLPRPCPLCAEGRPKVRILPGTYTLEVAADVKRTNITFADAADGKAYLDAYAGSECASVHRSEAGGPGTRHHMIYIDGAQLLASSATFRRRFLDKMRPWRDEVGAILSPDHDAARKMAAYARRSIRVPVENLDETSLPDDEQDLTSLPEDWLDGLRSKPTLLLIDDVVITASRLRRYLNALEPLRRGLGVDVKLIYLVGVARPPRAADLTTIPQMLVRRGEFVAVEQVVLPNWGEADCPWCSELKHMQRHGVPAEGALRARYDKLVDLERGLKGDDALLPWRGEPVRALGDSIFGEGTQTELFLSVAAALQRLRNEGRLDEEFRPPVAKVLEPHTTPDARFFEYRIYALILRACRSHDIAARLVERELEEVLRLRLAADRNPGSGRTIAAAREMRSELVLAAAQGKLPRRWLVRGGGEDNDRELIRVVLEDGEPTISPFLRHLVGGA